MNRQNAVAHEGSGRREGRARRNVGKRKVRTISTGRLIPIGMAVLMLFLGASWCASAARADETGDKKKELLRIQREAREKKQEIKRAARKERSILEEMERIDRDIEAGSAETAVQIERLRASEAALREVETSGIELSADLIRLKLRYRQRIRALYKMGRSGYALEALTSESLGQAIKRVKYLGVIARQDRLLIQQYGEALDRLAARQREIAARRVEVLKRASAVEAKKSDLEARRSKKADLHARVKREKNLIEQTLRELEESSASLGALIKKAEQEKRAAEARRRSELRRPPDPKPAGQQRLIWPVDGPVVSRFGKQHHPQFGTTVFRRGIELQAREGEAVRAVLDGEAVFADWHKGYGRLVILQHDGGLYTLYGYLSQIAVKRGDRAARGQSIGQAGDTGSFKGAKLYFEVRRQGEAEDPLTWLSKR